METGNDKPCNRNIHKNLSEWNNCCTFTTLDPPKPLNDAQIWGAFYFYTLWAFNLTRSIHTPLRLPSCRKTEVGTLGTPNGRSIISEILAIRGLAAICVPCCRPKEVHRYKADSSFQDALNSYRFDKKLRLFLFNDIEKVEIALRSALTNIVTRKLAISPRWQMAACLWMLTISTEPWHWLTRNWKAQRRSPSCTSKENIKGHLQQQLADFPMIDIKVMVYLRAAKKNRRGKNSPIDWTYMFHYSACILRITVRDRRIFFLCISRQYIKYSYRLVFCLSSYILVRSSSSLEDRSITLIIRGYNALALSLYRQNICPISEQYWDFLRRLACLQQSASSDPTFLATLYLLLFSILLNISYNMQIQQLYLTLWYIDG